MKRLFSFLQEARTVAGLAVIFGGTIPFTQEFGYGYLLLSTATAITIGLLVLWFLLAKWNVPRPGYLVAVGASALMGAIFGVATVAAYNGFLNERQWGYYCIFAFFAGTTGNGIGLVWHFTLTKKLEIMNRPE